MKVFIAGATGVLGRALVPLLRERGHEVRALVRSRERARQAADSGAELLFGDLLDAETQRHLSEMIAGCDAVAHIATAIPADPTAPDAWQTNTRLRTEGTRALLDAALVAGAAFYAQQSIVMAYIDGGERWLDESTPFDDAPARAGMVEPVRTMEQMVRETPIERLAWTILRGGLFVGPGTWQEGTVQRLREGRETVPCDGRAYFSPIHVADMAAAFTAALEQRPASGIFNITAEPLRQGEYLDRLTAIVGAPPPRRDPSLPCPPSYRCSNAAARERLGWQPVHSIWPGEATYDQ
jgi:nucleoside-diphosphate-sugar epimerase